MDREPTPAVRRWAELHPAEVQQVRIALDQRLRVVRRIADSLRGRQHRQR